MATFIALLRGVNVVGANRIAMADLRTTCEAAGFGHVRTFINSGNVVFSAPGKPATVEARLQGMLAKDLGLKVPVIVRTAQQWQAYLDVPKAFAAAAAESPGHVLLGFPQKAPNEGAAKELAARATMGERLVLQGDVLWIHYAGGVGRSKVTPASIDKAMGSPTTARNLNTVRKLGEMAAAT